jgi:hypothetical protein
MKKTTSSPRDEIATHRHEARLHARLEPLLEALAQHPIYSRVNDLPSLRTFMTSHVFAVWDFMTLLKTLQRSLTCVDVPWLPPRDVNAARLINTIVVGEETDEVAPGEFTSHFDLYVTAMEEVGADHGPIDAMLSSVRSGTTVTDALAAVDVPESTRDFVRTTMRVAGGSVHEVAASFLHGREDLVPMMFRHILAGLGQDPGRVSFRRYLERHIEVDEGDHGPMARQLLRSLCGDDATKWDEAAEAAAIGLTSRLALWDGVLDQIEQGERQPQVSRDTLRPPQSSKRVRSRSGIVPVAPVVQAPARLRRAR